MRTFLFGGSFDPPHLGHALVASMVLKSGLADEVWFVPCGAHPFGRDLSLSHHRIAMTELIVEPGMAVCTYEADKDAPSYSIETLDALAALHPDRTFSWLMGSDLVRDFDDWKDYARILHKYGVYVYPRAGSALDALYEDMIPLRTLPEIEVSSTAVRRRLEANTSVAGLLDPQVEAYIQAHRLYAPTHVAPL